MPLMKGLPLIAAVPRMKGSPKIAAVPRMNGFPLIAAAADIRWFSPTARLSRRMSPSSKAACLIACSNGQTSTDGAGPSDAARVLCRADDGNAWRLPKAFEFKDMGGSVVEGIGAGAASKKKGNLAF